MTNEALERFIYVNDKEDNPFERESICIGRSELAKQAFAKAGKAATTTSTILLTGETGTGKDVIARYIHQNSNRKNGPFIAINCAALPYSLIASELFGYDEGAFTGARKGGHPGKFELADGGTIFLDEIGDMPLDVQVSLLRILQEREVLRLGSSKTRRIDVRVIAATHRNLPALVAGGLFRQDLYYRLKVICIELPPLRQRIEDIWDFVPLFMTKYCEIFGKESIALDNEVYNYLFSYAWPGNIRELENCVESMVAMADNSRIRVIDLPEEVRSACGVRVAKSGSLLDQQTKQAILQALKQANNKIAPAAKLLGIGRNTLYRKMRDLDIKN